MQNPNRIILTAARSDRTSFGCGTEDHYTYWDGCLIDSFPHADSWKSLYGAIQHCVEVKESEGGFKPSLPQAYFGKDVADLKIPRSISNSFTPWTSKSAGVHMGGSHFDQLNAVDLGEPDERQSLPRPFDTLFYTQIGHQAGT
jgi:hypothetical protein